MRTKELLLGLLAAVSAAAPSAAAAAVRVYATTSDIASVAREIAGDSAIVESLSSPRQNPHQVEPKPSLIVKLMGADLIIVNGLELEAGWLPPLLQGARNRKIQPGSPGYLDASDAIEPLDVPVNATRAMGDVHPAGNPHYMADPENVRKVARVVAARLSESAPAGKGEIGERLKRFEARLDGKIREWDERMKAHRGAKFVSYHKDWFYLAARYGLVSAGEVEPKPGIPPSPRHTAALIERMKAESVKLVLTDPWYERRTPEAIAKATGARVAVLSQMPEKGEDFIASMDRNVKAVADALEAK